MKVLITGIDGYTGWPLALHLLARGHDVAGIDNFVTRCRVQEVGSWSATPIPSFPRRLEAVHEVMGKTISFHRGDVTNYEFIHQVLTAEQPEAIVHLGEQRSAPYSMIDVHHAVETQTDNIAGTLNLIYAIRDVVPEAHLVKMGTMGEYGTPNIDIAEGFFDVEWRGRRDAHLPFPRQAGQLVSLEQGPRLGERDVRRSSVSDPRHGCHARRRLRDPDTGNDGRSAPHPIRLR